mmetsp:Transcript_77996/g.223966  ORF Transcript_77996/g.223966 Transcript_77996/m.223966 type:complete len:286 (-) Transcript_77996:139-996(-)|eukprot:CAMPEP_0119501096 /NCGR_PEP_ID=MMETSP1344-20130328/23041_1 /TAXON_ID=236787 /ORGANISM="Florenciella parvula, Strain CCMP2471" /LENGTH=285 /DNA_ID=CAMNT_0007537241 /DNA_START=140 /DNA_END=997 /DNA_ORIENTATION=-
MDSNPDCHAYGETAYWDRRYNEERRKHGINHTFDWYLPCEELWPIIQTYCGVNKGFKVLVLGCGSSALCEVMYNMGFTQITGIDKSQVIIAHLQHRYQHQEGMEFLVMDATSMSRLDSNSIDLVIEKGCIDSLFCGTNSYNHVLTLNQEVCRVLKPGRVFISVSCGAENIRIPHFSHRTLHWEIDHANVPGRNGLHVYMLQKSEEEGLEINMMDTDFVGEEDVNREMGEDKQTTEKKFLNTQEKAAGGEGLVIVANVRDQEDLLAAMAEGKIRLLGNQKIETGVI